MTRKQMHRQLIRIAEAARILGMSKSTFYKHLQKGEYRSIYVIRKREGWMADIMDVFRYGYPEASADAISMLIYQYRADLVERKRRKKK